MGPIHVGPAPMVDLDATILAKLLDVHAAVIDARDLPVRVRLFPSVRPGVAYGLPAERTVVVGTAVYESITRAVAALPEPERARWILEP